MENNQNTIQQIKIFIKSLDEQKLEYNIDPNMTVKEFKNLINKDTSIEQNKIRLIYKARNLDDSKKINEILKNSGETIHLVARLKSNQQQQSPPLNTTPQQPTNQQGNFGQNFRFQNNTQNNPNILNTINSFMGNLPGFVNQNQTGQQGEDVVVDIQADVHDLGLVEEGNIQNVVNNVMQQFGLGNFQFNMNNQQAQNNQQRQNSTNQNQQQQTENTQETQSQRDVPLRQNNINNQTLRQQDIPLPNNQQQNIQRQSPDFEVREEQNLQQNRPDIPLQRHQFQSNQQIINQQQQNQNQQRQVHYMSNNPRRNQVLSVNQRGITLSMNSSVENQNEQIFLDNEIMRNNLQVIAMQNQIQYRQPRRGNDNSATLLGNYLKQVYENLMAFLPHLGDTAEILSNEPFILNQEQRLAYTRKIQMVGQMMQTYCQIFQNLDFLKRLNLGNSPMQFNLQSQNQQQTETDQQRIERERQVNQNMLNILQRGIDSRTTIGQLEQMAGDESSSDDLLHLLMRDMSFLDSMKFVQGDMTSLDNQKDKIKHRYQDVQLKNQNNQEKVREALLGETKKQIQDMFKEEGQEKIFEGFNILAVVDEVNDEYITQFQETLLQTNLQENEIFSEKLVNLLQQYTGKLAYEISEGLVNGIVDLEEQFKKRYKKTIFETMSNEMRQMAAQLQNSPLIDQMIAKIWTFVKSGYDLHKKEEEKKNELKYIERDLKKLAEKDQQIKTQELSQQYKNASL